MITLLLVLVAIAAVVGLIWFFTREPGFGAGARFPPGTRAFESEMTLPILAQMIEAREVQLLEPLDEDRRDELTRQIANMRRQAVLHQAVIDARDVSPGRMSIGVDPNSAGID